MKKILFCFFIFFINSFAYAKKIIPVRIATLEGLASTDSSYSERFKRGFEGAFFYAAGESDAALQKCGYKMEFDYRYFENSNLTSLANAAEKTSNSKPWVVFGPAKSNHFLMATKYFPETPFVSPLANAAEVYEQPQPHFTMSRSAQQLAHSLVYETKKAKIGKKYGVVIDKTCLSCKDFAQKFSSFSTNDFEKKFEILVQGESPNLSEVIEKIKATEIDFLLLPNYSQQTGYIISQLHGSFPQLRYLGGDGWGTQSYGFLTKYPLGKQTQALFVRNGLSSEGMKSFYGVHSIPFYWEKDILEPSDSAFFAIEFVRKIKTILCTNRPKTAEDLNRFLKNESKQFFQAQVGVGVFALNKGEIVFKHKSSFVDKNIVFRKVP